MGKNATLLLFYPGMQAGEISLGAKEKRGKNGTSWEWKGVIKRQFPLRFLQSSGDWEG
jgi:hypothetical protein